MAGSKLNHQDKALTDPRTDLDYTGFPAREVTTKMFRAKAKANGAWYFASTPSGDVGDGRFDLTNPRGTCYWATDAATALGERLGQDMLAEPGTIPATLLEQADIATAEPAGGQFADLGDRRAATHFAVTGELSKTDDYAQAQRYATTFDAAGLAGVLYGARYSGDQAPNAIAVFGDKGPDGTRQVDADTLSAVEVARDMDLTIISAPASAPSSAYTVLGPAAVPPPKKKP